MIFTVKVLPKDCLQVIEMINALRKELAFSTSDNLNRWYAPLARMAAARAMIGTNSIEGINVTLDDAVAVVDGETPTTAHAEDRAALVGYWNAMTYIVQLSK